MSTASLGFGDWKLDPSVVLAIGGIAAAWVVARRRGVLRADDDVAPWFGTESARAWCLGLGLLSGFVALASPIDVGGDLYLLSIHMVQHLLLMMIAPPLVLLGICGARSLPATVLPRLRSAWTLLTRPWPATLLFNAVLLVWHLPQLYNTTLTNESLHVVEHITFLAVGVIFWWPIVDPVQGPSTRPIGPFTKIAMLVVAGVPPTVLGFVFALGGRPFYDFYAAAPRLWGLSPTGDQALAGVIMLGVGNLIYFAAVSAIFLRMFQPPDADEEEIAPPVAARAVPDLPVGASALSSSQNQRPRPILRTEPVRPPAAKGGSTP